MSIIGANIKNIRTKKNISIKELAKKCGISELFLADIESGKRVPNTQVVNSISKALTINIEAIEPQYFSDYFDGEEPKKEEVKKPSTVVATSKTLEKGYVSDNPLSTAFTKAANKIPVLNKITAGKAFPFEGDIIDYKYEPVFQGKQNNVSGENFIYFTVQDNSMSSARIMKNDLALVFITDSIFDKDIILVVFNGKTYIRRLKTVEDKKYLLYPENPEFEVLLADKKDVKIIGKIVRVEFKV